MKQLYKTTLFIGLVALASIANAQQEQQPQSFSLDQCVDYAMKNNPNLKNSESSIASSQARVRETLASGLPQVGASADLGNNFVIPTTFLPAAIVGGPPGEYVGVKFGTQYVGRSSLNVDQMIFNGSYFVGLKASQVYTELSRQDLVSTKTDLVIAIKKAYYSVLVNQERLALVEKNYQRLDSLLAQTKAMFNNGFSEKIDVSRVQVQFNNIVNLKRTTTLGMEISKNLLKFQMGYPMAQPVQLTDDLESIKLQALDDAFTSNFNYVNRVEYRKLDVNSQLVQLDIKNTKSQYLPRLDAYGNYGASYGTSAYNEFVKFGTNWKSFGVFGIRANLPIFDGLRKSNQIQQKKIQLQQIENTKVLLKNQIDMEQNQNMLAFNTNVETLKAQKENLELADEVYKVSVIKYQQGVGSNIEVITADASLKEAQTNYYAALYDALIASVDLEKAYGKVLNK
jgi:outer membrane protein TolC